jgi:hypothetical protein
MVHSVYEVTEGGRAVADLRHEQRITKPLLHVRTRVTEVHVDPRVRRRFRGTRWSGLCGEDRESRRRD